jgi:hypothetical protein
MHDCEDGVWDIVVPLILQMEGQVKGCLPDGAENSTTHLDTVLHLMAAGAWLTERAVLQLWARELQPASGFGACKVKA